MRSRRFVHCLALAALYGLITLPALGATSLWDMDEGVNAECAREMQEAGTWVVPTFNWELRTAKPVMLYWLTRLSYAACGVSEWSARLPSAACGLGTVLLVYELGRRMYGPGTGLLAGVVLASTVQFTILTHAATPDATLLFCTVLTYALFWVGHQNGGRRWWVTTAMACGLAALTKGPVGVALPGFVVLLYFLWNREFRRLLDARIVWAAIVFVLVAGPWYGFVTSETRGEWARKFFANENVNRALSPQEGHSGPVVYYLAAFIVLFAPWSCVIGATLWYAAKGTRRRPADTPDGLPTEVRANRFLLCWFAAYLGFFSLMATKLPNYVAPVYPAAALLTARFLTRWRAGENTPAKWVMPTATAGVAATGALLVAGLLLVSGAVTTWKGLRTFPGLEAWAWIGLLPLAAAAGMAWGLRAGRRTTVVASLAAGAIGMVGATAAGVPGVIDQFKAAKTLVLTSGAHATDREVRLAAVGYFQESLVFYAERKVARGVDTDVEGPNGSPMTVVRPFTPDDVADLLASPLPTYVFVPEPLWDGELARRVRTPVRVAGRKYDFYRNEAVLVVTNERER